MMRSDRDEGMGIPSNDESIVIGSSSWHHDHDLFGGRKKGGLFSRTFVTSSVPSGRKSRLSGNR
jgi:hypothetical protein